MASQEEPKRKGWLTKWRGGAKREQQLTALQQGFSELVDLTRSIREHMDQQARTQETLLEMMKHIPGAVEGLKSVGKATEQQTETLSLLKQQLEAAARNEGHLVESMRSFNKTLALMDEMSKRTSQTVSSIADQTKDSEDLLRNILERSERRLVYMIVTLMVVTLTVLGVGLYFGLGGRPHSVMIEPAEPLVIEEPFEHKKSITDLGEEPEIIPPAIVEEETEEEEVTEPTVEPEPEPVPEEEPDVDLEPEVDPVETDEEAEPVEVEVEAVTEEEAAEAPQDPDHARDEETEPDVSEEAPDEDDVEDEDDNAYEAVEDESEEDRAESE